MKKILFATVALTAACLLYFFGIRDSGNASSDVAKTSAGAIRQSLWAVSDSANMVMVSSVGLGKEERRKVIGGRLYRNFAQLLKMGGDVGEKGIYEPTCKTGARLEFYRDTALVGTFRLTDRIAQEGFAGTTWKRSQLLKVNKFLKKNGVHFQPCDKENPDNEIEQISPAINQRATLTMPEFGAKRKAKKRQEETSRSTISKLSSARDSTVQDSTPQDSLQSDDEESETLMKGLRESSLKFLQALDEMIMPADTAVGEPLWMQFSNWNRGEIVFYDTASPGDKRQVSKVAPLDDNQMKSFGKLLKRTSLETFERRGNPHYSIKAKVILYRDSLPEMELWLIDNHYNALIKFPLVKGVELGDKGFWTTDDPLAVRRFFDGLK